MALHMTMTTARLTLAVSLSAILASCSTGHKPSAMAIEPGVSANDRYIADSEDDNAHYAQAIPRTYIDADLVEDDAPEKYTVVRGDTLWDISDRFLKEPWRWSEIWNYNPKIYNPNLIFPGDVLALEYVNGKPALSLTRRGKLISADLMNQAWRSDTCPWKRTRKAATANSIRISRQRNTNNFCGFHFAISRSSTRGG